LGKDKNLAHTAEVLNNAGSDLSGPGGTLASLQAGHLIVLILIYIKYTKKCEFDNYAAQ
jgi:hypothetical protein